ncbi:MAG: universal stress protein [Acidimicrobiia bacterium]|nr:universal stress protein [Acidimicrobiia bacterium]
MTHIVVAVDGSDSSRTALRLGALLASTTGNEVRAVRCWEYSANLPLPSALSDPPRADEVEAEHAEALAAFVDETLPAGTEVVTRLRRGPAAHKLLEEPTIGDVDALVVGSRGLGGFSGLILGSVSRQLVEHATVPVVVVREDAAVGERLERVVVAIDGSTGAERAAAWAATLAEQAGAELVAVHCPEMPQAELPPEVAVQLRDEARELMTTWTAPLRDRPVELETMVIDDDPRRALPEVAERQQADLLVVGARGAGKLRQLLLGSVADAVVRTSPVPVVVVPGDRPNP